MFVHRTYWMWTSGRFRVDLTIGLDPARTYLVTGALTGKSGADYGQVFISTLCTRASIDQVLCGIRDNPAASPGANISGLGIVEIVRSGTRVTVTLRGDGGLHRAEGVIYDTT